MESIYFVITWLCHRTCRHCYEDRFRPYYGSELKRVVAESVANVPRIIDNLPERMVFLSPGEGREEKPGRIILAGGEVLLEPVREPILYPALRQLRAKYGNGVKLIVQTTGDLLTPRLIRELRQHRVDRISVSGMDAYHDGVEPDQLQEKLTLMFQSENVPADGYHFFGAQPDSWIGKIWPRGRAHQNELSTATLEDNFCSAWSGGLNFLSYRYAGSEVSIDPQGNVFPCCLKTRRPLGNLLAEPLERILDRLADNPVYQAISSGQPQQMGLTHGWTVEKFIARSTTTLPSGRIYRNLCIGCDAFHDEVLAPALVTIQPAIALP